MALEGDKVSCLPSNATMQIDFPLTTWMVPPISIAFPIPVKLYTIYAHTQSIMLQGQKTLNEKGASEPTKNLCTISSQESRRQLDPESMQLRSDRMPSKDTILTPT